MQSVTRGAAALALGLAACGGSSGPVVGTVVSVTETEVHTETAALVELDSGRIDGSNEVRIIFDTDVPRCLGADGPANPRPGVQVRAEPADFVDFDSLDAMAPPTFQVKDVAVDCG